MSPLEELDNMFVGLANTDTQTEPKQDDVAVKLVEESQGEPTSRIQNSHGKSHIRNNAARPVQECFIGDTRYEARIKMDVRTVF